MRYRASRYLSADGSVHKETSEQLLLPRANFPPAARRRRVDIFYIVKRGLT